MRIHNLAIAFVVMAFCLNTGSVFAASANSNSFARDASRLLAPYDKAHLISGAVLVAKDGHVIFARAYGKANYTWDIANQIDTKFLIGSITKEFTATAILQLVEKGKLKLDDPVSAYYPDAPESWREITIQDLLSHRSGLPNYTAVPDIDDLSRKPKSPEELIALFKDKPLQFKPGTQYSYTNSGYVLLGYLIEKISGLSYCAYLQQNILTPLKMEQSSCAVPTIITPHLALSYKQSNGVLAEAEYLDPRTAYAAGQIISTVDDLLLWQQGIVSGKVLSPAMRALAQADHGSHYGFGWVVDEAFDRRLIWHNGGIAGYHSVLDTYPDAGLTIIYLSNLDRYLVDGIGNALAELYFSGNGGRPKETVIAAAKSLVDRFEHPKPAQGSEAVLRAMIAKSQQAQPAVSAPEKAVAGLGNLESVTWKSVGSDGADTFDLVFENGHLEWTILVYDGQIVASGFRRIAN